MSWFGSVNIVYIRVAANKSSKPMEFALDKDDTIQLSKILNVYPGVTGLKFLNPKTNLDRIVDLDEENKKFLPPSDGWNSDYVYICTYKPKSNDTTLDTKSNKTFDKKSSKSIDKKSDKSLDEKSGKSIDKKSDKSLDEKSGKSFDKSSQKKFNKASDQNKSNFNKKKSDNDELKDLPLINDLIVWYLSNDEIDKNFKTFLDDYGIIIRNHIKYGFGLILFQFASKEKQKQILSETYHMASGRRYRIRLLKPEYVPKFCPVKLFVKTIPRILRTNDLYNYFTNIAVKDEFVHIYKRNDDTNFAFVIYMNGEIAKDLCKKKLPDYKNCQIIVEVARPSNTNKTNENANTSNVSSNSNSGSSDSQVNFTNLTAAHYEQYRQQRPVQPNTSVELVENIKDAVSITSTILGWFRK